MYEAAFNLLMVVLRLRRHPVTRPAPGVQVPSGRVSLGCLLTNGHCHMTLLGGSASPFPVFVARNKNKIPHQERRNEPRRPDASIGKWTEQNLGSPYYSIDTCGVDREKLALNWSRMIRRNKSTKYHRVISAVNLR